MHYLVFVSLIFLLLPQASYGIKFDRYHDLSFINEYLADVAEKHPHVHIQHLGYSSNGHDISYLRITKNSSPSSPAIYINGTHHGNEKASTEAALGVIDYLARKHNEIAINRLLNRFQFIIQPVVNPDGHLANSRYVRDGIDPNRDYPSPFADTVSFQLKETQLVSRLMRRYKMVASAALHSGMEAVLWPWGHKGQGSKDAKTFFRLGKIIADAMNIKLFKQSFHDYQTEGEFIDYAYMKYGTYAMTVEVSALPSPSPALLPKVVRKTVKGMLALSHTLDKRDKALLGRSMDKPKFLRSASGAKDLAR